MTKAKITTLHQDYNFFGSVEKNREYVMGLLDTALRQKPDLVCLPEAFTSVSSLPIETPLEELAESLSGPTIEIVAKKARKNNAYIMTEVFIMYFDFLKNLEHSENKDMTPKNISNSIIVRSYSL